MYIEYCNYNKVIENYNKEISGIFKAIDNDLEGISTSIHLLREIKPYIPDSVTLSVPIDYPLGQSSGKAKEYMVLEAAKAGANSIDYVPNNYLFNLKFKEIEKELQTCLKICNDYGLELRLFLDYKNITNIVNVARSYSDVGVKFAFCTVGYHHDDFTDNILNCKLIEEKTNISMIFNGYIWKTDQKEIIENSKIFGMRLYNLELWCMNYV